MVMDKPWTSNPRLGRTERQATVLFLKAKLTTGTLAKPRLLTWKLPIDLCEYLVTFIEYIILTSFLFSMAINTMLEATKARQAKEIRDLRRKLRETRLILPPRAFAAIRTSEAMMASTTPAQDTPDAEIDKVDDDESDEDADLDAPERQREEEYRFDRICSMVTAMYDHASDAVRRVNEPPEKEESGVKVLSGVDLEGYHGDDNESEAEVEDTLLDKPLPISRSPSPTRLPRPISPPKVTITAGSPLRTTNPSPLRRFF